MFSPLGVSALSLVVNSLPITVMFSSLIALMHKLLLSVVGLGEPNEVLNPRWLTCLHPQSKHIRLGLFPICQMLLLQSTIKALSALIR